MADAEYHALLELLGGLFTDPRTGVLIVLLVIGAAYDWRSFRVPNWLTGGGLVFGLAWTIIVPPVQGGGWTWPASGVLLGFLSMLPFYLMRAMGAGDVKLMAMTGAFLGWYDTLFAMLFSFVVAGVAAIAYAACQGATVRMLTNVRQVLFHLTWSTIGGHRPSVHMEPRQSVGKLAYGISIAVGTIVYMVTRQLGFI
jgi:prepilin peptidase CpaA